MAPRALPQAELSANIATGEAGLDRRSNSDRRKSPTSPAGALPPAGRRAYLRRAEEHQQPYFVDRYSWALLLFILLIVLGTIVDAVLTIQLIEAGASEINPVMDRILQHGALPFLITKYVLTVVGLPVLLIFKNYYLFNTRFRVAYLLPLFVLLYAILICYQLNLAHQYGW